MLKRIQKSHPIDELDAVISGEELRALQARVRDIHVEASVCRYIVQITEATRVHNHVYLGASPRGSIALFRTAQALAFMCGREFVIPDDVKRLAPLTLRHRMLLKSEARLNGISPDQVLQDVLGRIPVPVERGK